MNIELQLEDLDEYIARGIAASLYNGEAIELTLEGVPIGRVVPLPDCPLKFATIEDGRAVRIAIDSGAHVCLTAKRVRKGYIVSPDDYYLYTGRL